MKPTYKAPAINNLLKSIGFDRVNSIETDKCVTCKGDAKEFKDDLSRREFAISGMCQKCQDSVFN